MTCPSCSAEVSKLKRGVVSGRFLESCHGCFYARKHGKHSGAASHERERQREEHRRDIIQRYEGAGINEDFVRAYPELSEEYFSEDELRRF